MDNPCVPGLRLWPQMDFTACLISALWNTFLVMVWGQGSPCIQWLYLRPGPLVLPRVLCVLAWDSGDTPALRCAGSELTHFSALTLRWAENSVPGPHSSTQWGGRWDMLSSCEPRRGKCLGGGTNASVTCPLISAIKGPHVWIPTWLLSTQLPPPTSRCLWLSEGIRHKNVIPWQAIRGTVSLSHDLAVPQFPPWWDGDDYPCRSQWLTH